MIQMIPLKVFPSAGHHDKDPGAIANGYKEAELTKELRNLITDEFKKANHSFITDYDWETNRQYQNRIKPGPNSVVLDIHFNAVSNKNISGTEAFISSKANVHSEGFASDLVHVTSYLLKIPNRGVKRENESQHNRIGILNTKAGIACLYEVCFMSNPDDMKKYQDNKVQLAKAIADISMKYDNLLIKK